MVASIKRTNWKTRQSALSKWRPMIGSLLFGMAGLFLTYGYFVSLVLQSQPQQHKLSQAKVRPATERKTTSQDETPMQYNEWKRLAMELAALEPEETIRRLEQEDPFGVRHIKDLTQVSSSNFDCRNRISWPDQRNHTAAERFRQGHGMIFFQHLRKAGGTHFCSLAEANFERRHIPRYFCMPDYYWPQEGKQKCAGCLHQYKATEIMERIGNYRIAGNEWDSFDTVEHWKLVDTVYITSFRTPMDRAISQFRFECEEGRGCHVHDITKWWTNRRDLYNVYTRTFSDVQRQGQFVSGKSHAKQRADAVGKALDTVARFHLVLHMEFLKHAASMVQSTLGFTDLSALEKRVRPHNEGLKRTDSWEAKTYLNPEQYERMRLSLALDEILTDAARRLFFERLFCDNEGRA